jgi:carbamoyltransferase
VGEDVLMKVLGISCFYHDSAAALVEDGEIVAAIEEERFSREKHDNSFPEKAADFCLDRAGLTVEDLDKVVFYEKPIQKFDRILETAADEFPRGYRFFSEAMPEWLGTKLRIRKKIRNELGFAGDIEFVEHHHSHAASAYYPSPFNEAAILTVDGVGEWRTNQMFYGKKDDLQPLQHIDFPDSVGLLYSAITAFLGFMVNNDEYKVMGLASYGEPKYREEFKEFIKVEDDGSYSLDQDYFAYTYSRQMWSKKMEKLLGEPREGGEDLVQRHRDIAATLQEVLEDVLLKQVEQLYEMTDTENLCMAGGVALNSVANGKIRKRMSFKNIWVQPAAGDDGGALGAALERSEKTSEIEDVYLGPEYSKEEMKRVLDERGADYEEMERNELLDIAAERISEGNVVSIYQGRLEWGPRALGNRSIVADPRREEMIDVVNKKVKFREEFRPFAPTVLREHAEDYFDVEGKSPYMLFIFDVYEDKQEEIPAVTHVNGTSRIQTLKKETNSFYYDLISNFQEKTGVPVVLNTSFNLKGMPIVNTPEEAYINCFKESGIDYMVTENFLVRD